MRRKKNKNKNPPIPADWKGGGIQSKDTSVSDTWRTLRNKSIFGEYIPAKPQYVQSDYSTHWPLGAGTHSSDHKCHKPSTEVRDPAGHLAFKSPKYAVVS